MILQQHCQRYVPPEEHRDTALMRLCTTVSSPVMRTTRRHGVHSAFSTVRRSNLWFISLNPSHCRAAPHGWSQRSWTVIASCGTVPGANKQKPFGLRWGKKKGNGRKNKKIQQHTLKRSGAYRHCFSFSFRQWNPERKKEVVFLKHSGIIWGQTPNPDQYSCPLRRTKLQGTLWKINRIGWKGAQRRIHASRGMDFVLDITRALIDGSAAVCSASPPSLRLWLSDDVSIWVGLTISLLDFPACLSALGAPPATTWPFTRPLDQYQHNQKLHFNVYRNIFFLVWHHLLCATFPFRLATLCPKATDLSRLFTHVQINKVLSFFSLTFHKAFQYSV